MRFQKSWYSGMHFRKWASALLLFLALSTLYGFIFVLIRLEDTALLFGSIGLFLILAVTMYFSRKINWYAANNSGEILLTSGS